MVIGKFAKAAALTAKKEATFIIKRVEETEFDSDLPDSYRCKLNAYSEQLENFDDLCKIIKMSDQVGTTLTQFVTFEALKAATKEIEASQTELDSLRQQLSQIEQEEQRLDESIKQETAKYNSLLAAQQEAEKQLSTLETTLSGFISETSSLEEAKKEADAKLNISQIALNNTSEQLDQLKIELSEKTLLTKEKTILLSIKTTEHQTSTIQLDEAQKTLAESSQTKETKNSELQDYREAQNQISNHINALEERIQTLTPTTVEQPSSPQAD